MRTELAVDASRSIIEERDGFAVIRTPQNPAYHNGNFLFFARPPQRGDAVRWPQLFAQAFAADPRVKHWAFCWDAANGFGETQAFQDDGYALDEYLVMSATRLNVFELPEGLQLRPMQSDEDWKRQLVMQLDDVPAVHASAAYARFKEAQIEHHRRIAQNLGVWLGVFDGRELAGSCGTFPVQDGMARYQDVMVAKAYRNRGIARALIVAAGQWALEHFAARTLIIVADAGDFAYRIYQRAGFAAVQREARLWKAERT